MNVRLHLFTRDLRLHDNPALTAASEDVVIPLFVHDARIAAGPNSSPNRFAYLRDALRDLDCNLRSRGGRLITAVGTVEDEVFRLVRRFGVHSVHLQDDVSSFSGERHRRIRTALASLPGGGPGLVLHPGVAVVSPGDIKTTSGGSYNVFSAYWRRWSAWQRRTVLPPPGSFRVPDDVESVPLDPFELPAATAGHLPAGGESPARDQAASWLDTSVDGYAAARDTFSIPATSKLSPHLHFGTLSSSELADRLHLDGSGQEAFLRQLCWRDFCLQLLAAHPDLTHVDLRPRGDRYHPDGQAAEAWRSGKTGVPIIDAAMRQLVAQGWLHNRLRMLVGTFLTKHLYVDWRVGAAHFMRHLVDGDVANNFAGWQWVAGTGTDSRPNRVLSPVRQAQRFDPDGRYVRHWVPEIGEWTDQEIHDPFVRPRGPNQGGYPPPIVDLDTARQEFLERRRRR